MTEEKEKQLETETQETTSEVLAKCPACDNKFVVVSTSMPTEIAVAPESALMLTGQGIRAYDCIMTFVEDKLVEGIHYGQLAKWNTPQLYQGGAQLLAAEANLIAEFIEVERTVDHENQFYAFEFCCVLTHRTTGDFWSEGQGAAASSEKSSNQYDPGFQYHCCLAKARKRAFVDAVIKALALSGIFTYGLEELRGAPLDEEEVSEKGQEKEPEKRVPSKSEKGCWRIGRRLGYSKEDFKKMVYKSYRTDSLKKLSREQWVHLYNRMYDIEMVVDNAAFDMDLNKDKWMTFLVERYALEKTWKEIGMMMDDKKHLENLLSVFLEWEKQPVFDPAVDKPINEEETARFKENLHPDPKPPPEPEKEAEPGPEPTDSTDPEAEPSNGKISTVEERRCKINGFTDSLAGALKIDSEDAKFYLGALLRVDMETPTVDDVRKIWTWCQKDMPTVNVKLIKESVKETIEWRDHEMVGAEAATEMIKALCGVPEDVFDAFMTIVGAPKKKLLRCIAPSLFKNWENAIKHAVKKHNYDLDMDAEPEDAGEALY